MEGENSDISHHVFPELTELLSANIAKRESEKVGPTPATTGALHEPMNDGQTIEGGLRERVHQVDAGGREASDAMTGGQRSGG